MSKSKNKKGFSLIYIILCGLAIVLCVGLLSNLSSGGGLSSGNAPSATVPDETLAPGTRLPLTVELSGVQLLGSDGAAVESPEYVEVGTPLALTFSALPGYEYTSGMGGISWSNAIPVLVNNFDGTFTLTLDNFKGEVFVSITAVSTSESDSDPEPEPVTDPVYITWELTGCSTNDPNAPVYPSPDPGQSYQLILDPGYVAFPDKENIVVTGCQIWDWDPVDCVLGLSDPTGPITVTISCIPESFSFTLVFDGNYLESSAGRKFTVPHNGELEFCVDRVGDNVQIGEVQNPVNCKYEIVDNSSDDYRIIRAYGFTGDASLTVGSKAMYTVTHELSNCTIDEDFVSYVWSNDSVVFRYDAAEGYHFPDNISVTGASWDWVAAEGEVRIYDAYQDVVITVEAVEGLPDTPVVNSYFIDLTYTKSRTPGYLKNPDRIQEGETVELWFDKNDYVVVNKVDVENAAFRVDEEDDSFCITIWDPTGIVYVTIDSYRYFPVTYTYDETKFKLAADAPGALRVYKASTYEKVITFEKLDPNAHYEYITSNGTCELTIEEDDNFIYVTVKRPSTAVEIVIKEVVEYFPLTFDVSDPECFVSFDVPETLSSAEETVFELERICDCPIGWYLSEPENCSFRYEMDGSVTRFYFSNVTGPVVFNTVEHRHYLSIDVELTNCTVSGDNFTTYFHCEDYVYLTFTPEDGYVLPADIVVTGASDYSWDALSGELELIIDSPENISIECFAVPVG